MFFYDKDKKLADYEKVYLFDSLRKMARWIPVGLLGGGYWEIRVWMTKPGETLEGSMIQAHNEIHRKELDDNN
jgi:hypothetical protein